LSAKRYWEETESQRIVLAQRLWDWYYNDEDKIENYILYGSASPVTLPSDGSGTCQGGLAKVFPKAYKYMSVKVFNIVARVVDKLAQVYKNQPQRMLNGGKKYEVAEDGTITSIANIPDDRYQEMLKKSTIETKQNVWNAMAKLFNTVLVQPRWMKDEKDDSKSYMDYLIHTPAWAVVDTSDKDWLKPEAFYYAVDVESDDGMTTERKIIYWSETEHYLLDTQGNKNAPEGNEGKSNPYNRLPIAILRMKDCSDFWGEGLWDLVNANQEICEQVTNLAYVAKAQAHGQLVILDPTNSFQKDIQTGVDHPIRIHSYEQGQNPDVKYINANAALVPIQNLIDWYIKTAQMVKGLSPQQYSLESSVASGTSKVVDASEIEEIRKNDQNIIVPFESDLFDVTRTVYNHHNPNNKIDEKAVFSINFQEQKVLENQNDKNAKMKFQLDNNLTSIVRLIKEDNPGMSDEEAEKEFKKIVAEKRMIKDELGLNDLFNQQEENNPNNQTPEEMMSNNNQKQPSAETLNPKTVKG
jgi:hypothetical protein